MRGRDKNNSFGISRGYFSAVTFMLWVRWTSSPLGSFSFQQQDLKIGFITVNQEVLPHTGISLMVHKCSLNICSQYCPRPCEVTVEIPRNRSWISNFKPTSCFWRKNHKNVEGKMLTSQLKKIQEFLFTWIQIMHLIWSFFVKIRAWSGISKSNVTKTWKTSSCLCVLLHQWQRKPDRHTADLWGKSNFSCSFLRGSHLISIWFGSAAQYRLLRDLWRCLVQTWAQKKFRTGF